MPLMRGLSVALFWNILFLKQHISQALLLVRFLWLSHSCRADIVTAAWEGQEGERRRQTRRKKEGEREREREERARRESLERGCRCSTALSHRLHANEEIPLQQRQQQWSGAAGGAGADTVPLVLDTRTTHHKDRKAEHEISLTLRDNQKPWPAQPEKSLW